MKFLNKTLKHFSTLDSKSTSSFKSKIKELTNTKKNRQSSNYFSAVIGQSFKNEQSKSTNLVNKFKSNKSLNFYYSKYSQTHENSFIQRVKMKLLNAFTKLPIIGSLGLYYKRNKQKQREFIDYKLYFNNPLIFRFKEVSEIVNKMNTKAVGKRKFVLPKRILFFLIASLLYLSYYYLKDDLLSKQARITSTYQLRLFIKELLQSPDIEEELNKLLLKIFSTVETKQAAEKLVVDLLKNDNFMKHAVIFGDNLLQNVLLQNDIRQELKNIILKIIVSNEMKNESIELFKQIATEKEIEEIVAQFMKIVFLREDIFISVNKLLKEVIINTISQKDSKDLFSDFLTSIWADQALRWKILTKTVSISNITPTEILMFKEKGSPEIKEPTKEKMGPITSLSQIFKELNEVKVRIKDNDNNVEYNRESSFNGIIPHDKYNDLVEDEKVEKDLIITRNDKGEVEATLKRKKTQTKLTALYPLLRRTIVRNFDEEFYETEISKNNDFIENQEYKNNDKSK